VTGRFTFDKPAAGVVATGLLLVEGEVLGGWVSAVDLVVIEDCEVIWVFGETLGRAVVQATTLAAISNDIKTPDIFTIGATTCAV